MFQSILLAKLLLLLCIKSSVILARDRAPGEMPNQQPVIRSSQSEAVRQNSSPVEGCFMIVFEASRLPKTQSGILELFANENPPEGLEDIYQFAAASRRIRDDHFKRIKEEQKK